MKEWRTNALRIATIFPGVCFTAFFFLNMLLRSQGSSAAVPFGSIFQILMIWFGISVPLVYLGSFYGQRQEPFTFPVKVNQIPRQIPEQPWYMQTLFSTLVGGVLPFGAVFIEVFFLMSSLWLHQFHFFFGFLFLVFLILAVTCVEISIVFCYFQLCGEDYNWWWRSFLTSGSSALYLFLYCIVYFALQLDITKFLSGLLFFSYMFLIVCFSFS